MTETIETHLMADFCHRERRLTEDLYRFVEPQRHEVAVGRLADLRAKDPREMERAKPGHARKRGQVDYAGRATPGHAILMLTAVMGLPGVFGLASKALDPRHTDPAGWRGTST
ncbi:MAG TPA: hypothetical protein VFL31_00365 [Nitrospiraceae bacterium]|nr:hypothetical protein [Nitrospiraceae bacterium]